MLVAKQMGWSFIYIYKIYIYITKRKDYIDGSRDVEKFPCLFFFPSVSQKRLGESSSSPSTSFRGIFPTFDVTTVGINNREGGGAVRAKGSRVLSSLVQRHEK